MSKRLEQKVFFVTVFDWNNSRGRREPMSGYEVSDHFFAHRPRIGWGSPREWHLSHIPSGYAVPSSHRTLDDARRLAHRLELAIHEDGSPMRWGFRSWRGARRELKKGCLDRRTRKPVVKPLVRVGELSV